MGHLECLSNIVSVLHKGLLGQAGVEGLEEALTLGTAVDDHAVGAAGFCHRHALADTVDEGLFAEWFDDTADTDDADTALDA